MHKKMCVCEYDGTSYHGWQCQSNLVTVQGTIEHALKRFYNEDIRIIASGRTDTGVHALGQVFHFNAQVYRENYSVKRALNTFLPADIRIISSEDVPLDFHALKDAKKKTYLYKLLLRTVSSAILKDRVWLIKREVDEKKLHEILQTLVGKHDFGSFCTTKSLTNNNIREIYEISLNKIGDILEVRITGNGFLHNMVRIIVGTAVKLHLAGKNATSMREILLSKSRLKADITAPASGLYLEKVYY